MLQTIKTRVSIFLALLAFHVLCRGQNLRPLSELNTGDSESYPYLNSAGTKLYFVKGGIGYGKILLSTRAIGTYEWSTPTDINVDPSNPIVSFWLSDDELTIYYTTPSSAIFYKTRTNATASFTSATRYSILYSGMQKVAPTQPYLLTSPTFTSNGGEMYVFYNSKTNYNPSILKFVCCTGSGYGSCGNTNNSCQGISGTRYYSFSDFLTSPNIDADMGLYSGQIAKGNSTSQSVFDLSYVKKTNNPLSIGLNGKLTWTPTQQAYFAGQPNYPGTTYGVFAQPTINANRNIAVFVVSGGAWNSNDLFMVEYATNNSLREEIDKETSSSENIIQMTELADGSLITAFPNPTQKEINLSLLSQSSESLIKIRNLQGQTLKEETLYGETGKISVAELSPGIYLLSVYQNNALLGVKKIIVTN